MLITVKEFCNEVESNLSNLIDHLSDITGRRGDNERRAWQHSLPRLGAVLSNSVSGDIQIHIPDAANAVIEYRLPSASSWCDLVLLGKKKDKTPSVLILELKHWIVGPGDKPGDSEHLIYHNGNYVLHPSDQVRGYVEYSRRFHSTVQEWNASVSGCVYFSNETQITPFIDEPHTDLVAQYPIFNYSAKDKEFAHFIAANVASPSPDFAEAFVKGTYMQDRNLIIQVAKEFKMEGSPFVLLDKQREGFELILEALKHTQSQDTKNVIIVEGPPGSGKSALAANLWAELAANPINTGAALTENVIFVSTSSSQKSNWKKLFATVGQNQAASGIVLPSNQFNPGLTASWLKQQRALGKKLNVETWRENVQTYLAYEDNKSPDNAHSIAIIDEAHALINPSRHEFNGLPSSGWFMLSGPQAYHIIRSCKNCIFLLDTEQSYRDNETTTTADIESYAQELSAKIHKIDLSGAQFRCGGSLEYINWIESALEFRDNQRINLDWRCTAKNRGSFIFDLVDSPFALEEVLRAKMDESQLIRIVSSYSRKWVTSKVNAPHALPPMEQDFHIPVTVDGNCKYWHKIWNYVPNEDYTTFIQAPPGSKMHADPLCEVGCPYVIRGFDFDYLGVLWLGDLVRRGNRWHVNLSNVHETSIPKTKSAFKKGIDQKPLLDRIKRAYRILFTRALKGIYVWIEDDETREYMKSLLNK